MATPEHAPRGHETSAEHLPMLERAPEIHDTKQEKVGEESRETVEKTIEKAREEASKEAVSGRETSRGEHKQHEDESGPIVPQTREQSYKQTMKRVQSEMTAPERAFSKVIHNRVVESVSDTVGSTVARPNAILSGSIFACVLVLGLYLLAKQNGFSLSGFETIAAFIVGWILGVMFDFLRAMITGKRS